MSMHSYSIKPSTTQGLDLLMGLEVVEPNDCEDYSREQKVDRTAVVESLFLRFNSRSKDTAQWNKNSKNQPENSKSGYKSMTMLKEYS